MSGVVAVVGGGAWGSALAVHLARNGLEVRQWIREPEVVREIRERRTNGTFLPGVAIPDGVQARSEITPVLRGAAWVVMAVPAQFARSVLSSVGRAGGAAPVINVAKGIEEGSLRLPLEVVAEELGADRPAAALSGPSFAEELARGRPTAVVVASRDAALARTVQQCFASPALRLYTSSDPVGVQLGGALKNVFAIAAGVTSGLEMGRNARAALITRGLAELSRLGRALGGRPSTFAGLSGLGDLVLTCTSEMSRNHSVGFRLGRGEALEAILASGPAVSEGVRTTRSARELARRHRVEMPIVEEVHRMLFEGGCPRDSLERLMARPLVAEDPPEGDGPEAGGTSGRQAP